MPTDRISMHDISTSPPADPGAPLLSGVELLKYRETHNGRAPWDASAKDGATNDGATRPSGGGLTYVDVLKHREQHAGRAPWERGTVAADDASPFHAGKLTGVDLLKYRESHGGRAPGETATHDGSRGGRR